MVTISPLRSLSGIPTPSEHLQQLTLTHMPHYTDNWREAPLHTNLHMKTKERVIAMFTCKVAQMDKKIARKH